MLRLLASLALVPALVPACVSPWEEPPPDPPETGPLGNPDCPSRPPSFVMHDWGRCEGRAYCPIATGGTARLEVFAYYWTYAHVAADGPFVVEPDEYDDVQLRATETGAGNFAIHALRC